MQSPWSTLVAARNITATALVALASGHLAMSNLASGFPVGVMLESATPWHELLTQTEQTKEQLRMLFA